MIRFIIIGHRAHTTGDFKLDDICGGAGRLDILCRCVNSAFFLSHDLRKDVEVYLVLQGGEDAPKTVRFSGSDIRYLNPAERSTASQIRNAVIKNVEPGREVRSSPGVYVSRRSFPDILEELKDQCRFVFLREDGVDIRDYDIPENPCFIMGDDRDPDEAEEELIVSMGADRIRLGPVSLHANHCMIIVHNEIDRRAAQ